MYKFVRSLLKGQNMFGQPFKINVSRDKELYQTKLSGFVSIAIKFILSFLLFNRIVDIVNKNDPSISLNISNVGENEQNVALKNQGMLFYFQLI